MRNEQTRNADVRSLFHRVGDVTNERMSFEAEMIVALEAVDDLGQTAKATARFLRYTLELRYCQPPESSPNPRGPIEIMKEGLVLIPLKKASRHLLFPHDATQWRKSALQVENRKNRKAPFISTEEDGKNRIIRLHGDGGSRGRPAKSNPATQPRTVLSVVNAAENPTVLCAKREMEAWRLVQLEPAALREPDPVNAPFHLETNGANLPATLYHLALAQTPIAMDKDSTP